MKIRFTKKQYQQDAVQAVVECFLGQPKSYGHNYTIDPGRRSQAESQEEMELIHSGLANASIQLTSNTLLKNIREVQKSQNIPERDDLISSDGAEVNLDIEMETGTGKTYVYIRTMFELHEHYGWSKFIIVVPSIAIREGVKKSFEMTKEHFLEEYGKQARFFVYDSKQAHKIEAFSSGGGIQVMIINSQAFAARGKDARRIYMELDDFQSRKPIDVIKANRPILILDEPQRLEGKKTAQALAGFNPLFILRYSATHKKDHNLVYRLDALDAYNQKLVKKIRVIGIAQKGLTGVNAYLFLEEIVLGKGRPKARIEFQKRTKKGEPQRAIRLLGVGDNLYELSDGLPAYKGFVISTVDATTDSIEFTNGKQMKVGTVTEDVNKLSLARIQIRETIRAHFATEQMLFSREIKVLSLFFIDEVAKYRVYAGDNESGEAGVYAKIFEEEYHALLTEIGDTENIEWWEYTRKIPVENTHNGYFSRDKQGRLADPKTKKGLADDVDAYDLILRDKESLLSFPTRGDDDDTRRRKQVRFIFSHSALREGWDSPNVFNICTLKRSDNITTRRQEVGRGMRLCVDQTGYRYDDPATTHEVNILTVVANESYEDFVKGLQSEISESLSERPRRADVAYFTGKVITHEESGEKKNLDVLTARALYRYLVKNDYTDDNDKVTDNYRTAKREGTLTALPAELAPYAVSIFHLIDSVYSDINLPQLEDGRSAKMNPLNKNFRKKEFQDLWNKINYKAAYTVDFDSDELIKKAVDTLNRRLKVRKSEFNIQRGEQLTHIDHETLKQAEGFRLQDRETEMQPTAISDSVSYDLIGEIAAKTKLTRLTVGKILTKIEKPIFAYFRDNPEFFITQSAILIQEQKATMIIEHLSYNPLKNRYNTDIFTAAQKIDFSRAEETKRHHIYDYIIPDSDNERKFARALEASTEVVVYAKLPRGFAIPTPVGNYNPDWAIAFDQGKVKHIFFIAETKGSLSSLELRRTEECKIECARKFFEKITSDQVRYDIADNYDTLMRLVSG